MNVSQSQKLARLSSMNVEQDLLKDEISSRQAALESANQHLRSKSAEERIAWALRTLPSQHILSSSFGAQSAVSLHLITQQYPNIPVVLIDTGYLFDETYQFIDQLVDRLQLNLQVYRPSLSAAWQEARKGKRWEQGVEGIEDYNLENKVEPMQQALSDLSVGTWFAGLRRDQAIGRADRQIVESQEAFWKVHPIVDWSDRDVHFYLKQHRLPYHPLWEAGYISIGDRHTTRSVHEVDEAEQTRFFGLKRECGLHEIGS